MRLSLPFRLLGGLVVLASAKNSEFTQKVDRHSNPGSRLIVEFNQDVDFDTAVAHLTSLGDVVIVKYFNSTIFPGASIKTLTESIDSLRQLPFVSNVWDNGNVRLHPQGAFPEPETFPDDTSAPDYDVHAATGVKELHASGIMGKGAKVAIIDTGIDYTHPALGGCFGPGCKVVGGWDFREATNAGERNNTMDYLGHGTAVAGVLAGNDTRFVGVAPEATLYSYLVPTAFEDADKYDLFIEALLRAEQDGVDVISMSLVGWDAWGDYPVALAASRLIERGIVVVICAGNDGDMGPGFHNSFAAGKWVLSAASVNVDVPSGLVTPSNFSSWGSLPDLTLKPDIAAPGQQIFTTNRGGGYVLQDGTSFATPYVAGIAALWIGHYGGRSTHGPSVAKTLIGRMVHTAGTVPGTYPDGRPLGFDAPIIQLGNGLVDARKVLHYNTTISWAKFSLLDTAHFEPLHSVNITNTATVPVAYKFGLLPAAGFELLDHKRIDRIRGIEDLVPVSIVPNVTLPVNFTVEPGQTKTAMFVFDYPKGLTNLPAYSGKVSIEGNNGEVFFIPYFGLASGLRAGVAGLLAKVDVNLKAKPIDNVWYRNANDFECVYDGVHFNLNTSERYITVGAHVPWVFRGVRWDIFENDWDESMWRYPPSVGQHAFVGRAEAETRIGTSYFNTRDAANQGHVALPLDNHARPRGSPRFWLNLGWSGALANGTDIAPGQYKMRFAVLKPFGDPHLAEEWETRIHPFTVIAPTVTDDPPAGTGILPKGDTTNNGIDRVPY